MPEQGSGLRLKQAREAAELGVAQVAAKMRVPIRVVQSLEAEDWERLGAAVFIRGQLRSYARVLGLPPDTLQPARDVPAIAPPKLEPRTFTPRYQRFMEQAARRTVYVVITATLAVPVWMVTRGHMDGTPRQTASLDLSVDALRPQDPAAAPAGRRQPQQRPYVASMTPIQTRRAQPAPSAPVRQGPALSLHFDEDSWVDIRSPDGSQVEQALIRAGEERSYAPGEIGRIVLGNAGAVELRRYGDVQDLAPYRRANVARFTVSSDGSLAPAGQ